MVVVFLIAFGVAPMWTWLLTPFLLLALIVLTAAVSMILSSLYPRFRDLAIIWTVALDGPVLRDAVLYPLEKVPGTLRDLIVLNPLASLLELWRKWVIDPSAPGPVDLAGGWLGLLPALAIFVATCVAAIWVFDHEAPRIAEVL